MRVCPNCGIPLGGSPRYCAGCATKVGPEHEATSEPLAQASPGSPFPAHTPVPAWAFHDPPAPWVPADPGWDGRHPSPEPDESPWPSREPRRPPSPPAAPGRARLRPWPRLSPGHGMTVTAMATTVALLVTGGVAAWQVGQMRSRLPGHEHQPGHARRGGRPDGPLTGRRAHSRPRGAHPAQRLAGPAATGRPGRGADRPGGGRPATREPGRDGAGPLFLGHQPARFPGVQQPVHPGHPHAG